VRRPARLRQELARARVDRTGFRASVAMLVAGAVLALALLGCAGGETANNASSAPNKTGRAKTARVPQVENLPVRRARRKLVRRGFRVKIKRRYNSDKPRGSVAGQRPIALDVVKRRSRVVLIVSRGPKPAPTPPLPAPEPPPRSTPTRPTPTEPTPPGKDCDPSYKGACLDPNAADYDCAGGTGDGPKYLSGTVRVVGSDPYGLDGDGDGVGCNG
jgi:hypothetical protein